MSLCRRRLLRLPFSRRCLCAAQLPHSRRPSSLAGSLRRRHRAQHGVPHLDGNRRPGRADVRGGRHRVPVRDGCAAPTGTPPLARLSRCHQIETPPSLAGRERLLSAAPLALPPCSKRPLCHSDAEFHDRDGGRRHEHLRQRRHRQRGVPGAEGESCDAIEGPGPWPSQGLS